MPHVGVYAGRCQQVYRHGGSVDEPPAHAVVCLDSPVLAAAERVEKLTHPANHHRDEKAGDKT